MSRRITTDEKLLCDMCAALTEPPSRSYWLERVENRASAFPQAQMPRVRGALGKSVGSCSGGLMDQAPLRNHPSTGVAYRNVRIVSSAEPGFQLRQQIGLS